MLRTTNVLRRTLQRTARVDWDACLTVHSPQPLRDNLNSLQSALNKNKATVASIPAVIPTVDWASWEDKVPADQLAEIKANYEALTFPAPQASNNGAVMEDFVAKYSEAIAPVTEGSKHFLADMEALKAKLQEDYVTMKDWEAEDWARRFPGLVDQARARHLVGDLTEDDHTEKYLDTDNAALAQQVKNGEQINPEMPEDVREYYFGGIATEGDFPTTPKDFLDKVKSAPEGGQTPQERADTSYIREYGSIWQNLWGNLKTQAE